MSKVYQYKFYLVENYTDKNGNKRNELKSISFTKLDITRYLNELLIFDTDCPNRNLLYFTSLFNDNEELKNEVIKMYNRNIKRDCYKLNPDNYSAISLCGSNAYTDNYNFPKYKNNHNLHPVPIIYSSDLKNSDYKNCLYKPIENIIYLLNQIRLDYGESAFNYVEDDIKRTLYDKVAISRFCKDNHHVKGDEIDYDMKKEAYSYMDTIGINYSDTSLRRLLNNQYFDKAYNTVNSTSVNLIAKIMYYRRICKYLVDQDRLDLLADFDKAMRQLKSEDSKRFQIYFNIYSKDDIKNKKYQRKNK